MVSRRFTLRRTLLVSSAALAAGLALPNVASAATLLPCTGTQTDLRAQLALQANANADGGPLDDGFIHILNTTVDPIFPLGIPFLNMSAHDFYANVNGTISFGSPIQAFTPTAIPGLPFPAIAGYFGDVDLRAPALQTFAGSFTLCTEPLNNRLFVTWKDVDYFNASLLTHVKKTNSFQVILTNNDATVCPTAHNFEIEFRYETLNWTTGDQSGGTLGLGGTEATAGIDNGAGSAVALPGSGTATVLNLVTGSNVNDPGVFDFLLAQGQLPKCGDGVVQLCEQCDDANTSNSDACTNLCLNAVCGDGFLETNVEACDGTVFPVPPPTCPVGYSGTPLCNNDPANPNANGTCTISAIPDGCTDINECTLGTDNCSTNATCTNTQGGFTCMCNAGFTGDGVTCVDIDECTLGTDNCSTNATCTNTPGSFTCMCNMGYSGDGVTCVDIDECTLDTDNCSTNATCTNTQGGFTCMCNPGYSGDGITCVDIDECALGTDNCSTNATCTNTPGSFTCMCNPGFTGDGVTCTPTGTTSSAATGTGTAQGGAGGGSEGGAGGTTPTSSTGTSSMSNGTGTMSNGTGTGSNTSGQGGGLTGSGGAGGNSSDKAFAQGGGFCAASPAGLGDATGGFAICAIGLGLAMRRRKRATGKHSR